MDKLPLEILVQILSYVPPPERLNTALTCSRWAQAVSTPELLKDLWLTIESSRQLKAAEAVLMKSRRQYINLKVSNGMIKQPKDLYDIERNSRERFRSVIPVHLEEYNAGFWAAIGRSLRKLEFCDSSCPCNVFFEILRACSELESLDIWGLVIRPASFKNFRLEEIEPFRSVRHLRTPRYLTETAFEHLLRLLPNATSISLTLFKWSGNLVNLLPDLLGENRLITELDVEGRTSEVGDLLTSLIGLCSASVEVLRVFNGCLSHEAYDAIGEFTNLRRLTIEKSYNFLKYHMMKILLNNPGLEALELGSHGVLTDVGLMPQLKKLRQLVLPCKSKITVEFLNSLRTIPSLRDVQFQGVEFDERVNEVVLFRNIASLPNLTTLIVVDCSRLTESDFAKFRQFKQLRSLSLDYAGELTDVAVAEGFGSSALESLSLSRCPLTDHGLASIGAHHSRLRTIELGRCRDITAAGLVVLLRREPLLRILFIPDTPVTEKFFEALEELCPRLRHLEYNGYSLWSGCHVPESFRIRRPAVNVIRHPF